MLNPIGFSRMFICMKRSLLLLFAMLVIACTSSCGKKQEASNAQAADTAAQPADTQNQTASTPEPPGPQPVPVPDPTVSDTKVDDSGGQPDVTALTIQLRRWMMNTRSGVPRTWEDYVAKSGIKAPPAPAGKKYIIRQGWVALVDK